MRSSSPWICALTPLGPSSRISLPIFFASSELMPSLSVIEILLSRPDWRGSEASRIFRLCWRLMSLSLNTSRTADARSSAEALISIACSPCHSMVAPVPLKSKRVAISRAVWPSALSTSCRSILLTMSNELSAISLPPGGFGSQVLPCYSSDLPSARQTQDDDIPAGCPSGQWERTVNPSALPSKVRILHLPLAALAARHPTPTPCGGLLLLRKEPRLEPPRRSRSCRAS